MNTDRELMRQWLDDLCGSRLCSVNSMSSRREAERLIDGVITAMRERLARDEERQYDADHVVLEKGTNDCVCTHCGQRYHIHMPVPMSIMTAIVDAFLEAHHQCAKQTRSEKWTCRIQNLLPCLA